jgi:protein ImuB
MLWLALQFPRLGLEIWEQAGLPEACGGRSHPTVLLEDNQVVLQNDAAGAAGIRPGATLATANGIVADLVHFHRDETRERERLEFLGEAVYRFSGQVSVETPDALVLEVGASLELFGDAAALARQAQRLCASLGHETRWHLASTPGAALVMATANVECLEEAPLTRARLPDPDKHLERLANMGFHTLAPLLTLPDTELARRFGPQMVSYLARLTGREPDPKRFLSPASRFDQSLHLLEPVSDKHSLLTHPSGGAPMQRLLRALEQWLVSHQLGAEQLVWSFSTHTETDRVVLPLSFARAQQSQSAFMNVARLKLEQTTLPEDVLNVRLRASRLVPWLGGGSNLFRLLPAQSDGSTAELIDQLQARLGSRGCTQIAVRDQHAPETAWIPVQAGRHARPQRPAPTATARPLWLFDPPRPTERTRLTLLRGPERIRTAWWQQTVWRDYYVASLDTGAHCWAFVDTDDRWYLHGYFG